MGKKEIKISPGVAFAIRQILYPRVKEVHDPTTPESSGMFEMKMNTRGSAEIFKQFILNMIPEYEQQKRAVKYLQSYHELRLLAEAGIDCIPLEVEDDEE